MQRHRRPWHLAPAFLLAALPWNFAQAQAWLPPAGELAFSVGYSDVLNKYHYLPNGDELDAGHTRSRIVGLSVAYAPADRLLLKAGIPYVQTRYRGAGNHGPDVDHGHENRHFTDLRVELHYQALEYPVAIAPYVAAVVPTNDYPVLGHAAPGRGLHEYWLGFFAGKTLDEWLPNTYAQLRYNYAFVEKVVGISHDRSNVDMEIGHFLVPDLSLQLIGSWQWAHGGVNLPVPPSSPLFPYHDQLAAAGFLTLSGGLSWFPTARHSVSLTYTRSLHGSNAHKVDRGLAIEFGFSPSSR